MTRAGTFARGPMEMMAVSSFAARRCKVTQRFRHGAAIDRAQRLAEDLKSPVPATKSLKKMVPAIAADLQGRAFPTPPE